jgi:hypothetical protein
MAWRRPSGHLEIDLRPDQPLGPVLSELEARRAKVRRIHLDEGEEEGRELRIEVQLPPGVSGRELVENLSRRDEVIAVRWDE